MASVNKVIIIGNLGRDPEVRFTANGNAVCNLSVATTRSWKNKESGEKVEETEWHRIVCYDRQAEVAGEYLRKGRPVYVEGRLKTRKWTDKDKVERYTTEIVADVLQLMGSGADKPNAAGNATSSAAPTNSGTTGSRTPVTSGSASSIVRTPTRPAVDPWSDDIPF